MSKASTLMRCGGSFLLRIANPFESSFDPCYDRIGLIKRPLLADGDGPKIAKRIDRQRTPYHSAFP